VAAVGTGTVTTLEGLAALWKGRTTTNTTSDLHPVQQAWIDEQVPQCGYCQNGMMVKATELLNKVKRPTENQISNHLTDGARRWAGPRDEVRPPYFPRGHARPLADAASPRPALPAEVS